MHIFELKNIDLMLAQFIMDFQINLFGVKFWRENYIKIQYESDVLLLTPCSQLMFL